MKIAVIGGGAAGFFAAINCARLYPQHHVILLEKTSKLLAKVKVSGGGRCNVCHDCTNIPALAKHYPRGEKFLKKAFHAFSTTDTIAWFEERGVELKVEADGRMFPTSDSSQTIVDCLQSEALRQGVEIRLKAEVKKLSKQEGKWQLQLAEGELLADRVIVTAGGSPKLSGFQWLADLGLEIVPPVPSLFTFNMPHETIKTLMGVVAPMAKTKIPTTKLEAVGPLLITHWGMSGPAILKLSAWGARQLQEKQYRFPVSINWLNNKNDAQLRAEMANCRQQMPKRQIRNKNPFQLPQRLWDFLLEKKEIGPTTEWGQLPKKATNQLISVLLQDEYKVEGKTTFKEEFVTCGGVSLTEINHNSMEAKKLRGLYFAGEVLDIDGITGGFNFQAAWTTGFIAGNAAGQD